MFADDTVSARVAEPTSLAHPSQNAPRLCVRAVGLYKNHRLLSPEVLFRLIKIGRRLTITDVRLSFDLYDYVLAHYSIDNPPSNQPPERV